MNSSSLLAVVFESTVGAHASCGTRPIFSRSGHVTVSSSGSRFTAEILITCYHYYVICMDVIITYGYRKARNFRGGYKFSWLIFNPRKLITSSYTISIGVRIGKSTKILFHGNYKSKPISEIHKIL